MASRLYRKSRIINLPGAGSEYLEVSASMSLGADPATISRTVWSTTGSSSAAGATSSTSSNMFSTSDTIASTSDDPTTSASSTVISTTSDTTISSSWNTTTTTTSIIITGTTTDFTTTSVTSAGTSTSTEVITSTFSSASTSSSTILSSPVASSSNISSPTTSTWTNSSTILTSYTFTPPSSSSTISTIRISLPPVTSTTSNLVTFSTSSTSSDIDWTTIYVYTSPGSPSAMSSTTVSTGILSTQRSSDPAARITLNPASIAGVTLGALGAIAFGVLWLFCARRRQRKLHPLSSRVEDDDSGTEGDMRGPLDDEVDGQRAMEERYAGILAALHLGASSPHPTLPGTQTGVSTPPPISGSVPPSSYIPPGPGTLGYAHSVGPSMISRTTTQELSQFGGPTESLEPLVTRVGSNGSSRAYDHTSAGEGHKDVVFRPSGRDLGPTVGSVSSHEFGSAPGGSSYDMLKTASSFTAVQSESSYGGALSTSSGGLLSPSSYRGLHTVQSYISTDRRHSLGEGSHRRSRHSRSRSESSGSVGSVKAFIGRLRGVRRSNEISREGSHSPGISGTPPPSAPEFSAPLSIPTAPASPFLANKNTDVADPEQNKEIDEAYSSRPPVLSFVLSNPDSPPISPYALPEPVPPSTTSPYNIPSSLHSLPAPPWPAGPLPSPVPTEESRRADYLLHPRLREEAMQRGESDSVASLRDFEDYSRPINGHIKNRLYSWTTFGTQDTQETRDSGDKTISPHVSLRELEAGHNVTLPPHI